MWRSWSEPLNKLLSITRTHLHGPSTFRVPQHVPQGSSGLSEHLVGGGSGAGGVGGGAHSAPQ